VTKSSWRKDIQLFLTVLGIGGVIGWAYSSVVYLSSPDADGSVWVGIVSGALIFGATSAFELKLVSRPESKIRSLPFITSFLIRVLVHVAIIISALLFVQLMFSYLIGTRVFVVEDALSNTSTDIIFSFLVVSVFVFLFQARNFIGGRNLKYLMLGRYYRPQIEERVFMIIDIAGSTIAAEKIGDEKFHRFLNRLFILFDDPIHKYGGEVHSYVGDAIIAVWPLANDKRKNTRVFQALLEIQEICREKEGVLINEFNIQPNIHAAIHAGRVAVGEMGLRKRQITYLGNTLNLTFRLENLSKNPEVTQGMVVSNSFLQNSNILETMRVKPIGKRELKGSKEKLDVSSISIIKSTDAVG